MQQPSLFNAESFDKAIDLGQHFEVRLTNGKNKRLSKNVVGNELTLEQYRGMILRGEWLLIRIKIKEGKPQVTDENGVLRDDYPSFLYWKHEKAAADHFKWFEGGVSRFATIKPVKNGDPNNGETVCETLHSWAFPSLGYGRIGKNQFGKPISFAEAREIASSRARDSPSTGSSARKRSPSVPLSPGIRMRSESSSPTWRTPRGPPSKACQSRERPESV